MSWPGFFALSNAWLFALFVPLILFYFLKLRRPAVKVPSLVLWRQVLADQRVNSPFQKFKRHILLLLQLILLALLILAAMQPYIRGRSDQARRLPVLIDVSASMAARGEAGGIAGLTGAPSRLDVAKARVRELIDNLAPDQELALVAFGRSARRLTGFTNNKRELTEALSALAVEDVPTNLEDALRLAEAIGRSEPFDKVLLLSDGNFPLASNVREEGPTGSVAQVNFELPFTLDFQRLPPAAPNLGISTLNARRAGRDEWNVFVTVEGSPGAQGTGTVELSRDGELVATERVALAPRRAQNLVFRLAVERPVMLEVKLTPDQDDSLPADNLAYLRLTPARSLFVYCPESMLAYRMALRAIEGVRLFPEEGQTAAQSSYDLLVTDRPQDQAIEAQTSLFVGLLPQELEPLVELREGGTSVVDWQRTAPLLEHVQLARLVLLDRPVLRAEADEAALENRGYEVLAYGREGPLLLRKREGAKLVYVMAFHSDRSTLPYDVAFPILLANLVQVAMEQAGLAEARPERTGVLAPLPMGQAGEYEVRGPGAETRRERADERGVLAGVPAPRVGRYQVSGGGQTLQIGASLLNPTETSLVGVDQIQFKEVSVRAAETALSVDRPLWPTLVLLALVVLLVEWWFFQRRPAPAAAPVVAGGGR